MKNFKEWLSDYLRYFMLILAVVLMFVLVLAGVRVYRHYQQPDANDAIEILTEQESVTAPESESETKPETVTEKVTESETESETEKLTETEPGSGPAPAAAGVSNTSRNTNTGSSTETQAETRQTSAETEETPQTQAQTEPETEVYTPVYKTLTGACNFRSGPSYEDNVITWYSAGTVVEFLEDVGGWYKVQIDGMIGYMGARFFY